MIGISYEGRSFWTWAVAFVSKDGSLNTAHVQYLETRLLQRAREARRARLDNQNIPREPALAETDRVDAESFLAEILSLLPVFGLTVFESAPAAENGRTMLTLRGQKIVARGYESPQGFVVVQGSQASPTSSPSARPPLKSLRDELLAQGALTAQGDLLVFTQECSC